MRTKAVKPKVDPYLEGLMAKLLERLTSLEKKMDAVLAQSGGKSGSPNPQSNPQPPKRHDRTMYEAICADCSKVCEVPFQPSEARAVYCKQCFANRKQQGRPGNNNIIKNPGMPVLTPVAMPTRSANKPMPVPTAVSAKEKKKPAKKKKKKK